jgi:membrane protein
MAGEYYPLSTQWKIMTVSFVSSTLKKFLHQLKDFIFIIFKHNIFFHSSSMSYYAALAIAPFILILLQVAALLGNDLQSALINQTYFVLGPEVGKVTEMVFSNANHGINLASISGIIGVVTLLFTASIVFLQLRFTLDNIYGDFDPERARSFKDVVKERLISMGVVILTAILFFLSLFISYIVKYFAGTGIEENILGQVFFILLNFLLNLVMFSAIYYFAPSRTPPFKSAIKIAFFTSIAFIFGKILMGLYFKNVAMSSVYGAAGTLLVFLLWAYYSSFMLFLSLEGFLFLNPEERVGKVVQKKMASGLQNI